MKIISFLLPFFILGCTSKNIQDKDQIVATVDNDLIYASKVDSIAEFHISRIKQEILNSLINNKIQELYLKKTDINFDTILQRCTYNKQASAFSKKDSNYAVNYCYDSIINGIRSEFDIGVYLTKSETKKISNMLNTYNIGNNNANLEVILIFDYDCHACHDAKQYIDSILINNKNRLNIKYAYFSDYVSPIAIACDAAAEQNKFWAMFNKVFESDNIPDSLQLIQYAKSINLDVDKFKLDMNNKSLYIKKHAMNRQILYDAGVWSVPSFIVNGRVIDNIGSLNTYLKSSIQ